MAKYVGSVALRNDLKELMVESPWGDVEFMADKILTPISVKEQTGYIPKLPTSAGMKLLDLKREPRGTFQRGMWVWGASLYATFEYGYEEPIDNVEKLKNADIFNEEVVSTQIAEHQLKLAREKRVADAVYNTTTFTGAANTTTITEEWDDKTNADPYANITTGAAAMKTKCGAPRKTLHLLMNDVILRNIMRSDAVRSDIKYTKSIDELSEENQAALLTNFLGIKKIHVATSFYDTTNLGVEDATFSDIWSNEYMMLFVPAPNAQSWKVPGLGRQPVWSKFAPDYRVEAYDEPQTDSRIVRVREYRSEFINTKYGHLFTNCTT